MEIYIFNFNPNPTEVNTFQKRMFEIKCTDCGKTATVPFKPTEGKPVYCSACFSKRSLKPRESGDLSFSFDQKQAWARRGDNYHGRKEEAPANVFQRS
ncbi:MAG TPA: CxxC-x17-CxxC domain-containing protein [candidate division Zixibacteria bacterium]|nr:CxxC-x17-CxxC domain-containing protein [candidate division Zixibacteria bacterium]